MATATRPSRDQVVIQLATEQGVTDQGVIAKRLVEMGYGKITDTRVGQILRANSGRDQIVRFLEDHPDDTFTSVEISTWTKLDINKVNYVIDALQKRGLITYKVGQSSSNHRTLVSIVLTKRARAAIATRTKAAIKVAKGVDVAKLEEAVKLGETVPAFVAERVHESVQPKLPEPVDHLRPRWAPTVEVETQEAIVEPEPVVRFEPEPEPEPEPDTLPIADYARYPLIARLIDRERDLNEAAKLLDRHGLDELELAVLSKMDEYTSLEREVLAYVQSHVKTCLRP